MFGGRVDAGEGIDVQALSGRDPDDPPWPALDHLLGDALGQRERPDDVHLELLSHVGRGNVDDGAALQNPGVVHQDLDVPRQCFLAVAAVGHVELLDPERHARSGGLPLERLHLRVDLDRGDDVEPLLRQSHRDLESEARACASDQDFFHFGPHELNAGNVEAL